MTSISKAALLAVLCAGCVFPGRATRKERTVITSQERVLYRLHRHQARRVLNHSAPAEPDPFWLSDGWMEIAMQADRSGFIGMVCGQSAEEGELVDSRAQVVIASHELH